MEKYYVLAGVVVALLFIVSGITHSAHYQENLAGNARFAAQREAQEPVTEKTIFEEVTASSSIGPDTLVSTASTFCVEFPPTTVAYGPSWTSVQFAEAECIDPFTVNVPFCDGNDADRRIETCGRDETCQGGQCLKISSLQIDVTQLPVFNTVASQYFGPAMIGGFDCVNVDYNGSNTTSPHHPGMVYHIGADEYSTPSYAYYQNPQTKIIPAHPNSVRTDTCAPANYIIEQGCFTGPTSISGISAGFTSFTTPCPQGTQCMTGPVLAGTNQTMDYCG